MTNDPAMEFYIDMVAPTVADFMAKIDDRRLGCLACLCLSSMMDHYFYARSPDKSDAARTRMTTELCQYWALGQVRDVANAVKHVARRQRRAGFADVRTEEIRLGNLRAGWPISGTAVMVEGANGEMALLERLVGSADEFWREKLGFNSAA